MTRPAIDIADFYRTVLDELREQTWASRTTLRLANAGEAVRLVGESLADGVASMTDGPREDPTQYPTYQFLERERTLLIQGDTRTHQVRPPESLIDWFRVYAQMLAPIISSGGVVGVISVHLVDETRAWTEADVAALKVAQGIVRRLYELERERQS